MPLLMPRLGGPRKTGAKATAKKTVSREVARKVPLGRVTSPTQHDPRQQLQQRISQLGKGFVPGPGRPAPTIRTGLYLPKPEELAPGGKYHIPGKRGTARGTIGAGGTPTKSKTGGGVRAPVGQAQKLLATGRPTARARLGAGTARRTPAGGALGRRVSR